MLNPDFEIKTLPAFKVIGLKWEGSWQEINQLKEVIQAMNVRVNELEYLINPNLQLGLSYHTRSDGFVHYSVYEVSSSQKIPHGMIEMEIPEQTYLMTQHKKGQDISSTYQNISLWLKNSDYMPYTENNRSYYDALPIKYEKYPVDRDHNDPHFEILIPITKK